MEPRMLFAIIKEYRKMDINRMKLKAHIASGGTLEEEKEEEPESVEVHPDAF